MTSCCGSRMDYKKKQGGSFLTPFLHLQLSQPLTMAFTGSDICKVRFSSISSPFSPTLSNSCRADHVRLISSTVGVMSRSHSIPASPFFSPLSVFSSREDVVLTFVSTSSWYVVYLRLLPVPRLTLPYQTLLGYLYVCPLASLSSQAHCAPLDKSRNYSRYVNLHPLPEADADSFISALYNPQVLASWHPDARRRTRIGIGFFYDSLCSNVERLSISSLSLYSYRQG